MSDREITTLEMRQWLAAVASVDERPAVREIAGAVLDEFNELRMQTFGDALLKYCSLDDLPFLVRVAMGQAVKDVLAKWQDAGEPADIPTLKALFPRSPARAES